MSNAITWQRVDSGNFGASNSLFNSSASRIKEGTDSLAKLGLYGNKLEVEKQQRAEDDALGKLMASSAMEGGSEGSKALLAQAIQGGLSGKGLAAFSQQVQKDDSNRLQRQQQKFMVDNQQAVLDDKFATSEQGRAMENKRFGRMLDRDNKQDAQMAKKYGLTVAQFNHRRDMDIKNFKRGGEQFAETMGLNKDRFNYQKVSKEKDDAYRADTQKQKVKMDDHTMKMGKRRADTVDSQFTTNMTQRKEEFTADNIFKTEAQKQRKEEFTSNMQYKEATLKQAQDQFKVSSGLSKDKFTYVKERDITTDKTAGDVREAEVKRVEALTKAAGAETARKELRTDKKWQISRNDALAAQGAKARAHAKATGTKANYSDTKKGLRQLKGINDVMGRLNIEETDMIEMSALVENAQRMYGDKIDPSAVKRMLIDKTGMKWFKWFGDRARIDSEFVGEDSPGITAFVKELTKYGNASIIPESTDGSPNRYKKMIRDY